MPREKKSAAAPSRLLPKVLRLLRERGVDPAPIAASIGLPAGTETADEVSTTPADFEIFIGRTAAALGDPLFAVRLPSLIAWKSYNIGELAARSSPTLREAFERVVKYASLFYAPLAFSCEEKDGELVISNYLRGGAKCERYGNEYATASTLFHAQSISGGPVIPRRVFFAHEGVSAADLAGLKAHFGTDDISFGRATNGLAFPAEDAGRASVGHDPRLLATADALADRRLDETPPDQDFVASVAVRLRETLADGLVDARSVARKMKLGQRTLQRRLEEQGTTFTDLVERTRRDVALAEVDNPSLALAEVARRAGFSDAASFGRAFKRWTGQSPGQHRKSKSA